MSRLLLRNQSHRGGAGHGLDFVAKDEELRLQDENCVKDDRHFVLGSDAQAAIDVDTVLVVSRDRIDEPDR